MLVLLSRQAGLLKHLVRFCASGGDCDQLALPSSEVASISSIISTLRARVDPFSDSENESMHYTLVVSTEPGAFPKCCQMGLSVSENTLEVPARYLGPT